MNKVLIVFCFCLNFVRSQDTTITSISDNKNKVLINDSSYSLEKEFYYIDSISYKVGDYFLKFTEGSDIISHVGQFNKGKKEGQWTMMVNDTLLFSTEFKHGDKHGEDITFFKGEKIKVISYKNGLRKGKSIFYFENGVSASGKYSSDFVDFKFLKDSILIDFSNKEKIKVALNNQSKLDSIYQTYFILNPAKRSWLKKGVWKIKKNNKVIVKLNFNHNGVLEKKEKLHNIEDYIPYFITGGM